MLRIKPNNIYSIEFIFNTTPKWNKIKVKIDKKIKILYFYVKGWAGEISGSWSRGSAVGGWLGPHSKFLAQNKQTNKQNNQQDSL